MTKEQFREACASFVKSFVDTPKADEIREHDPKLADMLDRIAADGTWIVYYIKSRMESK